jgi:aldehyde:ferredoxin oxidoreductase
VSDLLRIDLTSGEIREEVISPALMQEYIGGKGVGSHLLLEQVGAAVDPLGPENKMIFAIGPLTGTTMPGSTRYAAYFVSPLTGGYCESYSGGKLATQFAATGYRVVVLEGRSRRPVYLEISDRGVAIHPADDLWGLDAYAAEDALLSRTSSPTAQACVIGPAGEKLVRFALVANNKWRCLGRGGPGAVLGSKRVKGIVWHGTHKVKVARPAEFKTLVKDMVGRAKDDPSVARYQAMGTVQMVRVTNAIHAFPTRYWQKGRLDDFEQLSGETMLEKYKVGNTSCPPCIMHCGNVNRVPDGEAFAGLELDGPEYETIYAFGGLCEIADFAQVMRLNDICDRLGIDTMTAGNLCGLAIEACAQGRLDLGLGYGDADGVAALLEKMAAREGIGDVFADGILRVEKEYDLEDVAVHVKGMEPAAFDPRRSKGMGLSYAITARGACHLRTTFYKAELSGQSDPTAIDGKGEAVADWENRLCIMDTLIYCRFYRDLVPWPFLTDVVNAALGTDYSTEALMRIADRVVTETHAFNARRGIGRGHETLPVWITDHPLTTSEGESWAITADEVEAMRRDYYAARSWDDPEAVDMGGAAHALPGS